MNESTLNRSVCLVISFLLVMACFALPETAQAQPILPEIELRVGGGEETPEGLVGFLQLLLMLSLLSLAPAFVMLMTSFTRIVVVLAFLRNAMATQNIPPNQVLIGLALFMTFFVMHPTLNQVYAEAIQPYLAEEITQEEALTVGSAPLRDFMFAHTREKDLALFVNIGGVEPPGSPEDIPMHILVPSFVISELKTAFQMGFILFIPFLVIDMVVASTLMSMGMFMLPPVIVSMPFKILLFVLVDGWHLVVKSLLESFA